MKLLFILLTATLFISSCQSTDNENINPIRQQVVDNYASLVLANYEDVAESAKVLQSKVDEFIENPTEQGLTDCRQAWINSRVPYMQSEAFRFYGGPIDDDKTQKLIDGWPISEEFIDYVQGIDTAGIINDVATFPIISDTVILAQNGNKGSRDVKTGFHAIEFLLWGQDLNVDGPGMRPYTDFVEGGTARNQGRRARYLKIVTDLLVKDLESIKTKWQGEGSYRISFTSTSNVTQSLTAIVTGIGKLTKGELAIKKIQTLINSQNEMDESSRFSDNTHNDFNNNQIGINNVYLGRYTTLGGNVIDGTGLDDLVKAIAGGVNISTMMKLEASLETLGTLTGPIDSEIKHKEIFENVVNVLLEQADQITVAADAIGIKVIFPANN